MRMISKMIRAMQDTGLIDGMSEEDADTLATAALEAMREPSEEMVKAGLSRGGGFASAGNRMCNGYRGMIDAALNE